MASLTCFSKFAALLVLALMCFMPKGLALWKDDKIVTLPGQPPVGFNQYGGYITVDDKQQRDLFYYFVEAETEPQTKPLVLWLNGGPGCSSTWTAFGRNGPFFPKGDDSLIKNNFSWNRANMLYLDAPAGVGFSYSTDKSYYNFTNDEMTAQDNLKFLFGWLEKFPQYKDRDFFVTGVSYAGHFVPRLANLILESRLKSNLKGIALGSPLLDFYTDFNSRADFVWSHGMISDSTYSMFKSICNMSQAYSHYYVTGNFTPPCLQVIGEYNKEVNNNLISITDVLNDVCISSSPFLPEPKGNEPDACLRLKVVNYLNKEDVQEALHAKLVGINEWKSCSGSANIGYDLRDGLVPILPLLGKLIKAGIRATIYSGDQDSLIPLLGTRRLLNGLAKDLSLNTTVPYRSWLHNKQVGGWTQVYGDILSFVTIRGGGHDASFSQPERTLAVFQTFLQGKPLPLATTN